MLKQVSIVAAILTCANAYYNHAPARIEAYHAGDYDGIASGRTIASSVIDPHRGWSLYDRPSYTDRLVGGSLSSSRDNGKIIKATYPGAVEKSPRYAVTNPTAAGYPLGYEYARHGPAAAAAASGYAHRASSAIWTNPYRHHHRSAGIAEIPRIPHAPSASYNRASVDNYAHSRYYAAVTEAEPAAYATYAPSSYPISGGSPPVPIPSYGSFRHYHPVAIANGIEKIPHRHSPSLSHMGHQSHEADESYAW